MTRIILFTLVLLGSFPGNSQQHPIVKLEDSLAHTVDERLRIDLMNELAREYIYISPSKFSQYADSALAKSLRHDYKKGKAYAYRNLASGYSAQELFLATSVFIEKAITLFEELGDSTGIANCYITLGNAYRRQKDYENAIGYNNRAMTIFRKAGIDERLGVSLHNLAETEMLGGNPQKAQQHIAEAIAIMTRLENLPVLTSCYKVNAILAFNHGDLPRAENDFKYALKLSDDLGSYAQKLATTECSIYLARIAKLRKQPGAELHFLKQAIALATENKYMQLLRDANLLLMDHHIAARDYEAAHQALLLFQNLDDSLSVIQRRDKAAMLSPVLASIKNAERNEALEARQQLQQQVIWSQQIKLYAYLVTTVLLVIIVALLLYLYRQRKIIAQQLQEQKSIIEAKSLRLEETNITKDKFFGIVSHDLKSPLITLHNFITMLENYSHKLSSDQIKKLTADLRSTLSNTVSLTDNLITWSKSQMNIMEGTIEPVDLNLVIADTITVYKDLAEQKELEVIHENPREAIISGDLNQVQFIMRNLVNNAVKFTSPGGSVRIFVKDIGTRIVLTVADTGVGIPYKIVTELFQPGKLRSSKGTAGEKGTGLGLILVKEFVDKNNGQIQVESEPGKGSTFRLWFNKASDAERLMHG